jgi:hypothetical protein
MLKIIKLQIFCDFLHFKSRSGSASDETIRIHVALVPQHCYFVFGPPHLLAHFVIRLLFKNLLTCTVTCIPSVSVQVPVF